MLKSVRDKDMLKRCVIGLIIFIVILGIFFVSLDILDIDENYRLPLPISIFNTVFMFAFALLLAYLTAKRFIITGLPEVLALSGAQLILGTGSLLKGWLPIPGLAIPITLHESMVLIASLVHMVGGIIVVVRTQNTALKLGQRQKSIILFYLGVLVVISLVTLFVFQGIIPSFAAPGVGTFSIQDIMQETAALVFFASTFIYFIIYYRSRMDLHYWYFLGLLLFALGVLFVSLGHVEGRIAWLGRFSQYFGNTCFLIAVTGDNIRKSIGKKLRQI